MRSNFLHTSYRPQRSCGQGNVFTGVCLSTGGRVSASVHAGMADPPRPGTHHPPGADPPGPGRPPGTGRPPQNRQTPPPTPSEQADPPGTSRHPPPHPREADSSIRSTSGRYASYWNAFLFRNAKSSWRKITITNSKYKLIHAK